MNLENAVPLAAPPREHRPHLIPAWMVPLLASPLRRLWDNPERLLLPVLQPGSRVLELGPGGGFYTFPMARAIGPEGRIFCIELQAPVRRRLQAASVRRGLADRVQVRACSEGDLQAPDLAGTVDLAVAIYVLHEIPDPGNAIRQLAACLRPGGRLLIVEPRGHCPEAVFRAELAWAAQSGLVREPEPWALGRRQQAAVFRKA